jgi:hypothetical protein
MNSVPDLIVYQISRETVRSGKHDHVLTTFDPAKLGSARVGDMRDRVVFFFSGYDSHPDEIYAIPEVRKWIRDWLHQWPYLLHFASLQSDVLKVIYMARLDSLTMSRRNGAALCEVRFNPIELVRLLMADLRTSELLSLTAGISPVDVALRRDEVIEFFGLDGGVL